MNATVAVSTAAYRHFSTAAFFIFTERVKFISPALRGCKFLKSALFFGSNAK
jgi:hypothetical protein